MQKRPSLWNRLLKCKVPVTMSMCKYYAILMPETLHKVGACRDAPNRKHHAIYQDGARIAALVLALAFLPPAARQYPNLSKFVHHSRGTPMMELLCSARPLHKCHH